MTAAAVIGNLQSHSRGCRVLEIILAVSGEPNLRGVRRGRRKILQKEGEDRNKVLEEIGRQGEKYRKQKLD